MKSYQEYKEAGIRWINNVPKHWDVKPLFAIMNENKISNKGNIEQNVLSLSYGKIIRRDLSENFGLLPASFETYQIIHPGYIVLRLTDLQNDWNSLRVGLVKEKGIITSAYVGLESSSLLASTFAYYLLHAYDLVKVFYGEGAGVRQSMTYKDLRRMPIIVPPLPEQQVIANFLDQKTAQIDTFIEKKKQQIDLLQEQRTALINHAVTKGLNPDVHLKDSGMEWLGEIPSHWKIKRFKHLATIRSGQVDPKNQKYKSMTLIAPNHIESVTGRLLGTESADEQGAESGKYLFGKGDVLYSKIRPELRKACIAPEDGLCSADMYPIIPNDDLLPEYLLYLLLSNSFSQFTTERSMRVAMPKVNREALAEYSFAFPSIDEQKNILSFINMETQNIDNAIEKSKAEISLIQEYRTALISEAVTGKIDVR